MVMCVYALQEIKSEKISSVVGIHCLNVKGTEVNWTRERRQSKVQLPNEIADFFF